MGRRQADILLDDPKASGIHAEIIKEGPHYRLVDKKSTNGTYLNRRRVDEAILADQDVIEIGITTLCFFADIRDFHGTVEEVTASVKIKVEAPPEASQVVSVSGITTTTKTLQQPPIELEVLEGENVGKRYRFRKPHVLIGREEGDLVILDLDMSRRHALIEVLGPQLIFVRDLQSTNGTFVNEHAIESQRLKSGDKLRVGNTILRLELEDVSEATHES